MACLKCARQLEETAGTLRKLGLTDPRLIEPMIAKKLAASLEGVAARVRAQHAELKKLLGDV